MAVGEGVTCLEWTVEEGMTLTHRGRLWKKGSLLKSEWVAFGFAIIPVLRRKVLRGSLWLTVLLVLLSIAPTRWGLNP